MGSVMLPHLNSGWHVDQAILSEEERLVVIRFGRDWDPDCMRQDEILYRIADKVKNFAVIYVCDIDLVADFNQMYGTSPSELCCCPISQRAFLLPLRPPSPFPDAPPPLHRFAIQSAATNSSPTELYDPCAVMFFFRNKHMMCDFGTGNNNKLNFVLEDKQELIDVLETVYRGAKKGRGLVVSPKDYSTRHKY